MAFLDTAQTLIKTNLQYLRGMVFELILYANRNYSKKYKYAKANFWK